MKNYTGGVRIAPTDPLASWYVGGMPNAVPTLFWNAYQMIVTDPAPFSIVQKFYFNAAPDPTFQRLEAFPINYQATIQVRAMSTVQLSISDSNCQSISNCGVGGPGIPNTQCLPITVPAVTDPRVPQPYVGQFILINVGRGLDGPGDATRDRRTRKCWTSFPDERIGRCREFHLCSELKITRQGRK